MTGVSAVYVCPYCDGDIGEDAAYITDALGRPTCQLCACPYCDRGHTAALAALDCRGSYDMDIGMSHERLIG
jgi:hypothetical protein